MLGLLCGAAVAAAVGLATAAGDDARYMKVEDVKPGMKGYGLTVFAGSTPERFDVEILSTLTNFRPRQDLILIKTTHPRLEVARTVAGMSGSPIFVGGKMIGAYAYGWFFNVEPIAGVTPIHNMLEDLRRPIPPTLAPPGGGVPLPRPAKGKGERDRKRGEAPAAPDARRASVSSPTSGEHRFRGAPLAYDVRKHAAQIAERNAPVLAPPSGTPLRPASTAVMVGGLGPRAFRLATELLEPLGMELVQAGGGGGKRADEGTPSRYLDGGVLTVQLVRGDVSVSGLGTVTHVVGDKLIAFGHPMLQGGVENLPTALGRVHWILASQQRSFKIGEPVRPLGALVNDRQASIVVDTRHQAPVFPTVVDIEGVPGAQTRWSMEVAHDQFLAPSFSALAVGSALEAVAAERNDMTWRATTRVEVTGYGTLVFEDFGSGNGSPIGPGDFIRARFVRALGALLNNPWEVAQVTRVDSKVRIRHEREILRLRGAQLLASEIEPGEPARIRLELHPHQGKPFTQVAEVPIPRHLAGQKVRIKLEPSYTEDRIVAAPESMRELFDVLGKLHFPGEALVATFELPDEAGAALRGNVAMRLPPGAADTLRPTTQSVAPELFQAVQQVVIPTKGFVVGDDSVEVEVRHVLR
jgi:hypothetical protein